MPYTSDTPRCKYYDYDFNQRRWYCEYLHLYMNSRVECQHCPYCKTKKKDNLYDRNMF